MACFETTEILGCSEYSTSVMIEEAFVVVFIIFNQVIITTAASLLWETLVSGVSGGEGVEGEDKFWKFKKTVVQDESK